MAQLDSASPSEGEGCPFEPGREHHFSSDADGIRAAMALAERAAAAGDVPVGAVLCTGDRHFDAWNEREARPDPTAHAEMIAITAAARAFGRWRIGGTLFVTKEPCVMCAGAIAAARIERVVFGCFDPKGGAAGSVVDIFGSDAVNHRVVVRGGVLADETAAQLRAFFLARRRGEVVEWLMAPASKADVR